MTVASVNKRTTESKSVSCFTDSRPDVDITFRDVLLSRPTDHYLVGVDNFSLTSTSLSMIEPNTGDYEPVIRIVRNATTDAYDDAISLDQNFLVSDRDLVTNSGTGAVSHIRVEEEKYKFHVSSEEVILNIQRLMHRLDELADQVNLYMANIGNDLKKHDAGGKQEIGYVPGDGENVTHLQFNLRPDGKLLITGTRAFWANFSIAVPNPQYQFGIHGERSNSDDNEQNLRRYLSVHPEAATQTFNKIRVNNIRKTGDLVYSSQTLTGSRPRVHCVAWGPKIDLKNATKFPVVADTSIYSHANAHSREEILIVTDASIFSTMDRRVALELGCSLPIKNSPMIDHQKETPDFVLGRWIWKTINFIETDDRGASRRYQGPLPVCTEYQGSQDRITYHELQAQAKIQTLRLKLFARVRTFNTSTEKWGMRVVELPTSTTDWWHARLHFVSKD